MVSKKKNKCIPIPIFCQFYLNSTWYNPMYFIFCDKFHLYCKPVTE